MRTVKFEMTYKEKASRLELLIRFLWGIPTAIVAVVLLAIAVIAGCLQFVHILFLGKRHKTLYEWTYKFVAYFVQYECYKNLLTDERNPILPEN
ncbi:MAG: DUF4389 domain-containing protein [Candidatus Marsarchaeota archaeon]|nr:DUF4389 domain-containing protein [Candidatus Marsarchaeota archaeon]